MHPRILAFIDPITLQNILAEWRLQGPPDADGTLTFIAPSPALISQAGLMWRVSQVVCNALPQAQPEQDHGPDPNATTSQQAQTAAPAQRKFNMSRSIDQTSTLSSTRRP